MLFIYTTFVRRVYTKAVLGNPWKQKNSRKDEKKRKKKERKKKKIRKNTKRDLSNNNDGGYVSRKCPFSGSQWKSPEEQTARRKDYVWTYGKYVPTYYILHTYVNATSRTQVFMSKIISRFYGAWQARAIMSLIIVIIIIFQ